MDTADYIPDYVGGLGIAARIAWDELKPGVGPFDPQNILFVMVGPLSGTLASGGGRVVVAVGRGARDGTEQGPVAHRSRVVGDGVDLRTLGGRAGETTGRQGVAEIAHEHQPTLAAGSGRPPPPPGER